MVSAVWSLVTILAVFAVVFVGFVIDQHEALAAGVDEPDIVADEVASVGVGAAGSLGKVDAMEPYRGSLGVIEPIASQDPPVQDTKGCKADMRWPVLPHVVTRRFKAPKQVWGPGHRGVDIAAVEDTPLLAPANGFISFAGIVAGKSVVSIRHKSLTLTLEPAQTLLPIGTPVIKGLPIGTVTGLSDHCTGVCVHWGVRKSRKEYRDPQQLASRRKIVLKPVR
ncbi:peptidoglycan DD-metalloendopeptidase family protein [Bifidobacterium sp. ESL0775]|uniref:M23 family metallopeptidase n=1 Tax=Bifidobacterium sp. ESL0775 TaxID=2983230 RepID=UPI0023F69215|nr:peptidoglycan DD-metalloendopeptidase family protein [Bifidobacterium sp. ESL0775]WEV68520.1 peptidoglycan DD-metalloendopeptidase family protein [Bifidobacterium sp. ESL0775]